MNEDKRENVFSFCCLSILFEVDKFCVHRQKDIFVFALFFSNVHFFKEANIAIKDENLLLHYRWINTKTYIGLEIRC